MYSRSKYEFAQDRYFPKSHEIPEPIRQHIASNLKFDDGNQDFLTLVSATTRSWIKNKIRDYCNVSKFTLSQQGDWLKTFAVSIAKTKESVIDIVNAMLEILVKEQYELPALSTLERIAYRARNTFNTNYFDQVEKNLSDDVKSRLLACLADVKSDGRTQWFNLKNEPEKPSVRTLQKFCAHYSEFGFCGHPDNLCKAPL